MRKSNKRALKRIVEQINTIILAWSGDNPKRKSYKVGGADGLPPYYELMAIKGEGILIERFFTQLPKRIGMDIPPQQWLEFWHTHVNQGGILLDFIQRTQWLTVLSKGAELPNIDKSSAKALYCVLLAVLQERSPSVLALAVDDYFLHLWKQRFPSESTPLSHKDDLQQLRHKLNHRLRRLRSLPCESKESFVQQGDMVSFKLLFRDGKNQPWQTLIQLERPRLKTARLTAYEQVLQEGALEKILHNIKYAHYQFIKPQKRVIKFL